MPKDYYFIIIFLKWTNASWPAYHQVYQTFLLLWFFSDHRSDFRSNFMNASQAQTKSSATNEHSKETHLNFQLEFLYIYFFRDGMSTDSIYLVKRNMKRFLIFLHPFFFTFLMTNHPPQRGYNLPTLCQIFQLYFHHGKSIKLSWIIHETLVTWSLFLAFRFNTFSLATHFRVSEWD